MIQNWRLIDTGPLDGPSNMAVDEALLGSFRPESSLPVLRLYGWSPPALSLGRYQDASAALDLARCAADRVPVVRRMTGGGIIYHADELTYSIVCSPSHIGNLAGVKEGFRRLCGFLLGTYRRLGLEPHFAADRNAEGARLGERSTFCFAGKEECDIVVEGRKLGGNAQRRLHGTILQHGSIPLLSRVREGLVYLQQEAPGAEKAASLSELGLHPPLDELKRMLVASFEERLSARLAADTLTEAERRGASLLHAAKYGCDGWNLEGKDPRVAAI